MKKVLLGRHGTNLAEGRKSNVPFWVTNPMLSFVIILALVVINLVAQRMYDWQEYFIYSELGFSILALLMPWIAAFLYGRVSSLFPVLERITDLPAEQIAAWFHQQVDFIFHNPWAYLASGLFSAAGIMTMLYFGLPWSESVGFIFIVFWGMFMLATGAVGWIYVGLLVFLHRLSTLKVKGAPFEWPNKEFSCLNSIYLQVFVPGVILYLGMVVALWASGGQWMVLYNPLGRLWIFPIAGAVVGFFMASQYYIHRLMVRSKERRIDEIDKLVKETYDQWLKDRSVDRAKMVTELTNWRSNVSQEHDWPLELKSNLAIVSGLLLPTIKTIVDLLPR